MGYGFEVDQATKEVHFSAMVSRVKNGALITLTASAALLVPFGEQPWAFRLGWVVFAASVWLIWESRDPVFQRRMGVLLGCIALLALAPIETNTANIKLVSLGLPFLACILLPWLILRRSDAGTITYVLFLKHLSWLEVGYVLLSIPLAWGAFHLYFGILSPEVPFNWKLSQVPQSEPLLRLFFGINAVGIWDELFFVNTTFAILRRLFPFWQANLAQSVIYTAVLYDMAFTGWGPVFVFVLAITQGIMFERSKALVYVLTVHLIVDYFLFQAIVEAYYPNFAVWWHP